jgi:hypothetical protein
LRSEGPQSALHVEMCMAQHLSLPALTGHSRADTMLRRSPSERPFVHRAAFCWMNCRSADLLDIRCGRNVSGDADAAFVEEGGKREFTAGASQSYREVGSRHSGDLEIGFFSAPLHGSSEPRRTRQMATTSRMPCTKMRAVGRPCHRPFYTPSKTR